MKEHNLKINNHKGQNKETLTEKKWLWILTPEKQERKCLGGKQTYDT